MIMMAPPWGLSRPRAPKELFQKNRKSNMVTKQVFILRISTIFCMRETVIIPNGSRMLPCPLGLQNDLKTMIYFWTFFQSFCFYYPSACGKVPHVVAERGFHRWGFLRLSAGSCGMSFIFCTKMVSEISQTQTNW